MAAAIDTRVHGDELDQKRRDLEKHLQKALKALRKKGASPIECYQDLVHRNVMSSPSLPLDYVRAMIEGNGTSARAKLTELSEIRSEKVEWLWPGWIPKGCLTVLAGLPKAGKSLMTCSIVAAATGQINWPDGSKSPEQSAIMVAIEDPLSTAVAPRLRLAGAEKRVHLTQDVESIDALVPLFKKRPALLVIDPLIDMLQGDLIDQADMSRELQRLVNLAAKYDVSVLGVLHLSKRTEANAAMDRMMGSRAFASKPRSIIMCGDFAGSAEHAEGNFKVASVTCTFTPPHGRLYRVEHTGKDQYDGLAKVVWDCSVNGSAEDLIATKQRKEIKRKMRTTESWLLEVLGNGKPHAVTPLKARAEAEGFAWPTVRKAKDNLGVIVEGSGNRYTWRLPNVATEEEWDKE